MTFVHPKKKLRVLSEAQIQAAIIRRYEKAGWLVVKIIQSTRNGWPDLQCHLNNITIFIEVKAPGEKLSPLQKYQHNRLKKKGFTVLTIDKI